MRARFYVHACMCEGGCAKVYVRVLDVIVWHAPTVKHLSAASVLPRPPAHLQDVRARGLFDDIRWWVCACVCIFASSGWRAVLLHATRQFHYIHLHQSLVRGSYVSVQKYEDAIAAGQRCHQTRPAAQNPAARLVSRMQPIFSDIDVLIVSFINSRHTTKSCVTPSCRGGGGF